MAGRVISIEIGSALTKVVEMDYLSKNAKVYNSIVFQTPKGTIEDGYLKDADEFIDMLHAKLAAAQIKTKKVVFTVSSGKIANREVFLPLVSKDKIMSMVKANASDYFPMDVSNYYLTYKMLEKVVNKDEKKMKLLLLAVPLDLLDGYFNLARTLSMTIVSIDYVGNSIFQLVRDVRKQGTNISIHVSEGSTTVTIMEEGVLALQRVVNYGANSAVETLLSTDKYRYDDTFDEEKAYELFMSRQMINAVIPDEDAVIDTDLSEDEQIRNEVTESLRFLLGNIVRVIDYYMTKTPGAKIDMIYLSGVGAEFHGLRELFSFEIGSAVKSITAVGNIAYTPTGGYDCYSVMLPAIGATRGSMNLMPEEFKAKKVKNDSMLVPIVVCLAGIAAAVGMWLMGGIMYELETATTQDLQRKKDELSVINEVVVMHNNSQKTYEEFVKMYKKTENANEYLVAFINEMEEKMPSTFIALTMNVTTSGVSMNVQVASKEDAAAVIQQFRTFESIRVIGISGISEDEVKQEEPESLGYIIDEDGNMIPVYQETEADATEEVATDEDGSTIAETKEYVLSFSISCTYDLDYLLSDTTEAESEAASAAE